MRITHSLVAALLLFSISPVFTQTTLWYNLDENTLTSRSLERRIVPAKYKTFGLDLLKIEEVLAHVPERSNNDNATASIDLPMPDGSFERFAIVETDVMHPRLASKFPQIRTFSGQGIDDPSTAVYLDFTTKGFHAMVLKQGQTYFIDPYSEEDISTYQVYDKADFFRSEETMSICGNEDFPISNTNTEGSSPQVGERMTAVSLRKYEIAIAAAGEYTQYHGGTVPSAMAAIVTALNRVNGIYEVELAITFQLVPDNDLLIFTNPATDPYNPTSNPPTMHTENQTVVDNIIGNENYDIGHVLGVGSGGIATLESACYSIAKGRGMTSLDPPTGDPFYVDFLSHEIGHQMGAHHTFNSDNCGIAPTTASAYEPGSGSTIMSYAGICGTQNLQYNSHAYFHRESLNEITNFVTVGVGSSCPLVTGTGNNSPSVDADPNGMDGKYIPRSTPFELTAAGTDPDNDELTYTWEQMDLGPAGPPSSSATGPIIRSRPPAVSPTRMFPSLSAILTNTSNYGEYLPSITRTLTFEATARDNRTVGGGNGSDVITLNVTNAAGPFTIMNYNSPSVASGSILVQWNVAGTASAPVNCANVDILLSLDGGQTFTTYVSNTPNDGSENITLPNTHTGYARLKVKCSDNVFFDINNADIRIAPQDATCSEKVTNGTLSNANGWTESSSSNSYPLISQGWNFHNGDGSAWLGFWDDEVSSISQSVTIPANANFATLEFWYRLELIDCGNDVFRVKIGNNIVRNYTLCNDPAAGNWVRQLIDLTPYIGTTQIIMFESINDEASPTDIFIDDISIFTCDGGSFSPLPVELMTFEARADKQDALLHWVTASEKNNLGFGIEMRSGASDFQVVGFVTGNGTTNATHNYDFTVPGLAPDTYYFRLKQTDENGNVEYSPIRSVLITGDARLTVQPNPAKEVAFFSLTMEQEGFVNLQILDGLGRVVGTVADDRFSAGQFDFFFNFENLPEGIYYYRLRGFNIEEAGKFLVKK